MEQNHETLLHLLACVTGDEKGEFLPLDDNFATLQEIYREEVVKALKIVPEHTDLSGYSFEPNETFFICDDNIKHPFSKRDIDILIESGTNPYTNRKFSQEGIENLKQIKAYFRGGFGQWGGLLEILESLSENAMLGREDIDMLKEKLLALENAKTQGEMCEIVQFFGENDKLYLKYLNSPLLDGIYYWCTEEKIVNAAIVQFLYSRKINIDFEEQVEKGHTQSIKVMLELGMMDKKVIKYLFLQACKYGHIDIVKLFLEVGEKMPKEMRAKISAQSALYIAAANKHANLVKFLIEKGTDPTKDHILEYSCIKGNIEVVRILLENGVRADIQDALDECITDNLTDIAILLVQYGARITNDIFMEAVDENNTEFVRFALQNRQFPPNILNRALTLLLGQANSAEMRQILVDAGAVPDPPRRSRAIGRPGRQRPRDPDSDSEERVLDTSVFDDIPVSDIDSDSDDERRSPRRRVSRAIGRPGQTRPRNPDNDSSSSDSD
jgi:hypothetical protein